MPPSGKACQRSTVPEAVGGSEKPIWLSVHTSEDVLPEQMQSNDTMAWGRDESCPCNPVCGLWI